jgi:hypothetical protein
MMELAQNMHFEEAEDKRENWSAGELSIAFHYS